MFREHKKKPLDQRFWSLVDVRGPDECWLWLGHVQPRCYGQFTVMEQGKRKTRYAHRVAWTITYGDPGGLWVLHSCDNPICVNPNHLFLGTRQDNSDDKVSKNRQAQQEKHGQSKLIRQQVREIRNSYVLGKTSYGSFAKKFGVDASTISNIVRGKTWKGV